MPSPLPNVPDHRFLRPIGRGAYGEVWLAKNLFDEPRAIKVVRRNEFDHARSFERELVGIRNYEPVSRTHPGLVNILHAGVTTGGDAFYYVMELADNANATGSGLSGEDLDYAPLTLRRMLQDQGRLGARECVGLGVKLAAALSKLHAHRLVHRDIKPSNVIFVRGEPKLADAGLVAGSDEPRSEVGTRDYTPSVGAGTEAADCYSLGRMLHEAATGGGRLLHEAPTGLEAWPDRESFLELQEIIFRACESDPERRYESGAAMRKDLQRIAAGESLRRARRFETLARRFRRASGVGAVAMLAVIMGWVHEARRNAELARLESDNRTHLIQLHLSNAGRAIDDGFRHLATLWYAQALWTTRDQDHAAKLRWQIGALESMAPRLIGLGTHSRGINEIQFHSGGRRFVTGSEDGTAQVWDIQTQQPIGQPMRHQKGVNVVQFSRDGRMVLTAGADGGVGVWDAETGGRRLPPIQHSSEWIAASFSPDGRLFAAGAHDGRAQVWNTADGAEPFGALRHQGAVWSVEFSPDSAWLLTAGHDGKVVVWSAHDGQPRFPELYHPSRVNFATYSPDGRRILSACGDGVARFWNAESGDREPIEIRHLMLNYAGFSHDGRRVVTATGGKGEPSEVRVWNSATAMPVGLPLRHESRVRYAAFSPDDQWLATASHDGTVQVARIGLSGERIRLAHGDYVWSVAFSPDGRHLLTAGNEPLWRLWDLGHQASSPFKFASEGVQVAAGLSPDSRQLWVGGLNGGRFWRLDESGVPRAMNRFHRRFRPRSAGNGSRWIAGTIGGKAAMLYDTTTFQAFGPACLHEHRVSALVPNMDGTTLYTGDDRGVVRGWNVQDGSLAFMPTDPTGLEVGCLALNRRGTRLLACAGSDDSQGTFVMLDARSGLFVGPSRRALTPFTVAAFSPDDAWIALAQGNHDVTPSEVLLLDASDTEKVVARLPHSDGVSKVAFSDDSSLLATGDEQGTVQLWRVPSGQPVGTPVHHLRGIRMIDFSPDGRRLVTASTDGTAQVWDVATGRALLPALRHGAPMWIAQFLKEGSWILTASDDGEARLWRFESSDGSDSLLLQRAELNAGVLLDSTGIPRKLNPDEIRERARILQFPGANGSATRSPTD